MMRSFRLFLWLCRFLALFLLFSDHAVGAVQRGFVNLGFESPVISSAAPCRASIGFELIPGWVTDHPLDTQNISCPPGYTGPPYSGNARIIELWRGPRSVSSGQGETLRISV